MTEPITILNFSGAYEAQNFYKNMDHEWIDCSDLSGVNGFCDEEALEEIGKLTKTMKGRIHFIDGGNYHYLSYLMLKGITEPVTLIVFDHHTDMKPSMFEELLSCGCWIRRALDDMKQVRNVILIGVADDLIDTIEPAYADRVRVFSESDVGKDGTWITALQGEAGSAVYLSVDKDAFSRDEMVTDWDQGNLTLNRFREACHALKASKILGADVCGEAARDGASPEEMSAADGKNDEANRQFARLLLETVNEQKSWGNHGE